MAELTSEKSSPSQRCDQNNDEADPGDPLKQLGGSLYDPSSGRLAAQRHGAPGGLAVLVGARLADHSLLAGPP